MLLQAKRVFISVSHPKWQPNWVMLLTHLASKWAERVFLIHDFIVNCARFRVCCVFWPLFMGLKGQPKGAKKGHFLDHVLAAPLAFGWVVGGDFCWQAGPVSIIEGKISARNSSFMPRYGHSLVILCPLGQRQEKLGHSNSFESTVGTRRTEGSRLSHYAPFFSEWNEKRRESRRLTLASLKRILQCHRCSHQNIISCRSLSFGQGGQH